MSNITNKNKHLYKQALVAMSGGVDSSVSALLLQEAGYDICGTTMKLFDNEVACNSSNCTYAESTCCSQRDVEDAKQVALQLGFEHFTFNYTGTFTKQVIDKFCNAYVNGITPNPCIDCNRYLKFKALQKRRAQLGFDYVATGHYARRRFNEQTRRYELLRGLDETKDQSYVLFHLTQNDLEHMLFPLGELKKTQVRALANKHGFGNANKAESQDICFVPDSNYAQFIKNYFGKKAQAAFEPGPICNTEGKELGQHTGLIHYTIGQRKGIGVAAKQPLYVVEKRVETNTLVVGFQSSLYVNEVHANDINFIAVDGINTPIEVDVKMHYRQKMQRGIACMHDGELVVTFSEPVPRPAPGQALVLYNGNVVVGGGTITG